MTAEPPSRPDRAEEPDNQRFRDVLRGVNAIVWEWDVAGRHFTFLSDGASRILGYEPSHFLSDPESWRRIVHPDDLERVRGLRRDIVDQLCIEYRAINRSGRVVWLRDEVRRVVDGGTELLRGVATDVSETKRAEDALRTSRDFYFSLFDDFPTMIWRSREDGFCDYFNRAWLEFSGTSLKEELGDGWARRIHEDDREHVMERWRAAVNAQQDFRLEYRLRHRSGEYRPVLDIGRPFHAPDGTYLGYAGTVLDLNEQRMLEHQLRQAQKIEAVGQLAGGIAHDFNNILTAIQGHAELALQGSENAAVTGEVEEIRRSAARAAELTRQLLAFSRKQVLQPTVFEMGEVVHGLQPMLRRLIPENIDLRFKGPEQGARVHADRGQIEQVLLNLVVNARDAMPGGGTLHVAVDTIRIEGESHPLHAFIPGGDYVQLLVTDTGVGMDARVMNHIFEPFFTTKEPGRGTGLGLATAYGIVKQSDGFILARSEPGQGTTFEILLRRVSAPVNEMRQQHATDAGAGGRGGETILVVEDEQAVRRLVARTLRGRGYHVLEAEHADQALTMLDGGNIPELLMTDVVLPGTNGVELAHEATRRLPGMKVLLSSGFPRDNFDHGLPESWGFLEKPFSPNQLQHRVRELLDS